MKNPVLFLYTAMSLALLSCGAGPTFDKAVFDQEVWKNDKNGCNNQRIKQLEGLNQVKDGLVDLREAAVRKIMGKPDQVELYKRNQKFYRYFLNNGSQCSGQGLLGQYVEIRFSALNKVSEVRVKHTGG